MPRPCYRVLAALAVCALLLAACTSGSGPAPTPGPSVTTSTPAPATSAPVTPTPVAGAPTTATATTSCPLVTESFVHEVMGVRLARITVLRSGGLVVGCRFYAQQRPDSQCDAACLAGEHLPGPNQPAVEITTRRYASSTAAHNAFVLSAGTSAGGARTDFSGTTGLCFPNAFDPQDKGNDWACTVNKGPVLVLVRTVDTAHNPGTAAVLGTVLRAL